MDDLDMAPDRFSIGDVGDPGRTVLELVRLLKSWCALALAKVGLGGRSAEGAEVTSMVRRILGGESVGSDGKPAGSTRGDEPIGAARRSSAGSGSFVGTARSASRSELILGVAQRIVGPFSIAISFRRTCARLGGLVVLCGRDGEVARKKARVQARRSGGLEKAPAPCGRCLPRAPPVPPSR
eukprot:scaffold31681_cov30-Tisochrysis_lutea.AAC.1